MYIFSFIYCCIVDADGFYLWPLQKYLSYFGPVREYVKFLCLSFLSDGQGADRQAVLSCYRSCFLNIPALKISL